MSANSDADLLARLLADHQSLLIATPATTLYPNQTGIFQTAVGFKSARALNFCTGQCLLAKVGNEWVAISGQGGGQVIRKDVHRWEQRRAVSLLQSGKYIVGRIVNFRNNAPGFHELNLVFTNVDRDIIYFDDQLFANSPSVIFIGSAIESAEIIEGKCRILRYRSSDNLIVAIELYIDAETALIIGQRLNCQYMTFWVRSLSYYLTNRKTSYSNVSEIAKPDQNPGLLSQSFNLLPNEDDYFGLDYPPNLITAYGRHAQTPILSGYTDVIGDESFAWEGVQFDLTTDLSSPKF